MSSNYLIVNQRSDNVLSQPPLADVDWLGDPILAMIALVGSDVWHFTPFLTLVFIGGLATVPKDAQEAATIDGATSWMVFRDVTLPSILPVLAVGIVLKSIFSLKMFDQVYMLTNGGPGYATQTLAHYCLLYTSDAADE